MGQKWVKVPLNHLLEPLFVPLSLTFASQKYMFSLICIAIVQNVLHP